MSNNAITIETTQRRSKRRRTPSTDAGVAEQLAEIPHLPRLALVELWSEAHGHPPPKGVSRRLLEYAAAYHLQSQAFGGLRPAVQRTLERAKGSGDQRRRTTASTTRTLPPGSRLVREWHGRTYTVDVLEGGFLCDGQRYRSLSEVARAITGARWSGPRFFAP